MAIRCCHLREFCKYGAYGQYAWTWPRLSKLHTYIIIFSGHQTRELVLFNKVKHQVNVLLEEGNIHNTIHPTTSRNTLVVFELPELVGPKKPRGTRNKVQPVSELSV